MADTQTRGLTKFHAFCLGVFLTSTAFCAGTLAGRFVTCRQVQAAFRIAPNTDATVTLRALDLCQ